MTPKSAIIVGGGHNGLVCAAYLGRRGISVTVVEAREQLGGPAGRFEYMPGYGASITNSPGSFENTVLQELELERHGLEFYRPDVTLVHPFEDETFIGWRDRHKVAEQLEHYSHGESERYRGLIDSLNQVGAKSGVSLWRPSPSVGQIRENLGNSPECSLFDELISASLKEFLDSRLRSDQAKALLMMLAVNGQMVSPKEAGSGIGLLMRPFSMASSPSAGPDSVNRMALRGSVGLPIGSMSAIVHALVLAGKEVGVRYVTGTPAKRILTDSAGAAGVELRDGRVFQADVVVSTVEPSLLFNDLLDNRPDNLGEETVEAPEGSAFKIAVALDGLPEVRNLPEGLSSRTALHSQFRIGPTPAYIEESIHDSIAGRPSRSPIMWGLIPSLTSEGVAPAGRHLLSVNVWHAPHRLGSDYWRAEKEAFGRRCLTILEDHFPGLSNHITDYRFLDPIEIANELNLTGSNITHGNMLPGRLFGNRPHKACANYESGIPGLFLGGAGVWPGGYVTGAPGRNAAATAANYLSKPA